jgi:hypothetical protein
MRITKTLPIAAAALLALPGAAMAKDRNHDGLPDGWEKAHHLSLRVNQAHRDQDHDGLNNLSEFRHHSNPWKANTRFVGRASQAQTTPGAAPTQGDAGTVTSFNNGILTITLTDGSTLKGSVTPQTEVACEGAQGQSQSGDGSGDQSSQGGDRARIASDGGGDQGDQSSQSSQSTQNSQDSEDSQDSQGDDNGQGDDDQGDQSAQSSTCTIAPGDPVLEADLQATSNGAVFEEVKLAK